MLPRTLRWIFEADSAGRPRRPQAIAVLMTTSYAPLGLAIVVVAGGGATPIVVAGVAAMLLLPGVFAALLIAALLRVVSAAVSGLQGHVSVPLHEHRLVVSFVAFLVVSTLGAIIAVVMSAVAGEHEGLWAIGVMMSGVIVSFTLVTLGVSVAAIGASRPASILQPGRL